MDKLEEFFHELLEKNSSELTKVLSKTLIKEICSACYEIFMKEQLSDNTISCEQLEEEIIKLLEKNGT